MTVQPAPEAGSWSSLIPDRLDPDLKQDILCALLTEQPATHQEAERIIRRQVDAWKWGRRQLRKRTASLSVFVEPEAEQTNRNALGATYDAVCSLPEPYRSTMLLRNVYSRTATDTADLLKVDRRTITRWSDRARAMVRAAMSQKGSSSHL